MPREGEEKGTVEELLPGGLLKVKLEKDSPHEGAHITHIKAHVAEELKRVSVSLRAGDRVTVRRATNDPTRGSIVGVERS